MLLAASTETMAGRVETSARWSKQILSENQVKYTEGQQEAALTNAAVAAHSIAADLHVGTVFARVLVEAVEEDVAEVDEEVDVSAAAASFADAAGDVSAARVVAAVDACAVAVVAAAAAVAAASAAGVAVAAVADDAAVVAVAASDDAAVAAVADDAIVAVEIAAAGSAAVADLEMVMIVEFAAALHLVVNGEAAAVVVFVAVTVETIAADA